MFDKKSNDTLLAGIRQGRTLTRNEMLSLIVGLSIPSILAQVTNVLMFYIDAAMVGKLGLSGRLVGTTHKSLKV